MHIPVPGGPGFVGSGGDSNGLAIVCAAIGGGILFLMILAILVPSFINQRERRALAGDGPPATEIVLDGHSSLPGEHARLTFDPIQSQKEWVREMSVDAPYDGSEWWVTCSCSDDYMMLKYYTYQPPIDTPEKVRYAVSAEQNSASNDAAEPIVFRTIKVGDSDGHEFRYRDHEGREIIRVAIFGPVHSYRFECNTDSRSSAKYAQCEQALSTLRVDA